VKYKLGQRIADLRRSIAEYRFWGIQSIEIHFDAARGAVAPLVEVDEKRQIAFPWKKVVDALFTISGVIGNATAGYKHIHDAYALVEPHARAVMQLAARIVED
jgi:hypothetical protein